MELFVSLYLVSEVARRLHEVFGYTLCRVNARELR
jgi:hypothetical protein